MDYLNHITAPVSKRSLVDSLYERLLELILQGRLPSGAELNEVALARQLGVSRTPMHEALVWLAADGLIERKGGRSQVTQLTPQAVAEIYDVRKLLEATAAERAAIRMDAARLKELRAAVQELAAMEGHPDWPARAIEFDIRFHDAIAGASGSERLHAEIGRCRLLVRAFCRITGDNRNLHESVKEHMKILRALELHNPDGAREAMGAHVDARASAVLQHVYGGGATASPASPASPASAGRSAERKGGRKRTRRTEPAAGA